MIGLIGSGDNNCKFKLRGNIWNLLQLNVLKRPNWNDKYKKDIIAKNSW